MLPIVGGRRDLGNNVQKNARRGTLCGQKCTLCNSLRQPAAAPNAVAENQPAMASATAPLPFTPGDSSSSGASSSADCTVVAEDGVFEFGQLRWQNFVAGSSKRRPAPPQLVASGRGFRLTFEHRQHVGRIDHDAPPVFGFDQNLAGQDFLGQHAGAAVVGDDVGADRRQLALQVFVRVVFVAQAALQAAAAAGDFASGRASPFAAWPSSSRRAASR